MSRFFLKPLYAAAVLSLALLCMVSFIGMIVAVCKRSVFDVNGCDRKGSDPRLNIRIDPMATSISVTNLTLNTHTTPFILLPVCSAMTQDGCIGVRHSQTRVSANASACAGNFGSSCGWSVKIITQPYTTTTTLTIPPAEGPSTSTTGTITSAIDRITSATRTLTAMTAAATKISDPNNPGLCFNPNNEVLQPCAAISDASRLNNPAIAILKWISRCGRG